MYTLIITSTGPTTLSPAGITSTAVWRNFSSVDWSS